MQNVTVSTIQDVKVSFKMWKYHSICESIIQDVKVSFKMWMYHSRCESIYHSRLYTGDFSKLTLQLRNNHQEALCSSSAFEHGSFNNIAFQTQAWLNRARDHLVRRLTYPYQYRIRIGDYPRTKDYPIGNQAWTRILNTLATLFTQWAISRAINFEWRIQYYILYYELFLLSIIIDNLLL